MGRKARVLYGFAVLTAIILMRQPLFAGGPRPAISEIFAVQAIVGEASGEGYAGMLAVAGAIRNRGSLEGVYGVRARHIWKEPLWVWELAKLAWKDSRDIDLSCGGTHWESVSFKKPLWARKMKVTARVGKHVFYR